MRRVLSKWRQNVKNCGTAMQRVSKYSGTASAGHAMIHWVSWLVPAAHIRHLCNNGAVRANEGSWKECASIDGELGLRERKIIFLFQNDISKVMPRKVMGHSARKRDCSEVEKTMMCLAWINHCIATVVTYLTKKEKKGVNFRSSGPTHIVLCLHMQLRRS